MYYTRRVIKCPISEPRSSWVPLAGCGTTVPQAAALSPKASRRASDAFGPSSTLPFLGCCYAGAPNSPRWVIFMHLGPQSRHVCMHLCTTYVRVYIYIYVYLYLNTVPEPGRHLHWPWRLLSCFYPGTLFEVWNDSACGT